MRIDYAFGSFPVQVRGSTELIQLLSMKKWDSFQCEKYQLQKNTVLQLEKKNIDYGSIVDDGWKEQSHGEKHRVVFFRAGKPLFCLEDGDDPSKIIVSVERANLTNLHLGLQFGLLLALSKRNVGLHGVTLLCGDRIVILSAPSGTGKTTLANLLTTYCDAIVINGDFAMLSPTTDGVIFEPTPFCGSSGICMNHRLRVNRVVFLRQSAVNRWYELTDREALMEFMSNAFIPEWNKTIKQTIQENVIKCFSVLQFSAFSFAPTREAAEMFFNSIQTNKARA